MSFNDRKVWDIDGATRSPPMPINGRNEITLPDGSPKWVGNRGGRAALRRVTTACVDYRSASGRAGMAGHRHNRHA
jgi:hypothetical protein